MTVTIASLHARLVRQARIGWTTERVMRLAAALRISIYELCAMAGLFARNEVATRALTNDWPHSVCLHFSNFEDEYERLNGIDPATTIPSKVQLCREIKRR